MSTSGPGDDRGGSSAWDNPSWSSSLSDSSLSRPDEEPPNPWSREGSSTDPVASDRPRLRRRRRPLTPTTNRRLLPTRTPPRPVRRTLPRVRPLGLRAAATGVRPAADPALRERHLGRPYGSPPSAYANPTPAYGAPPPAYGSNPYEVAAYQPGYGTSSPYGVVPVSHPQSTTAMIFGILGIVLASSCGIGGLLGIGGIVQGRKARNEIDAQPGRYAGRSQAVAGIVTGTIGVVIAALVVLAIIAVVIGGIATGEF